ncbi:MAG: tRNA uridine-5-carboxymethylaminomethyl(34) synthesis GTPase MnmE [Ruminococcaceae bacterium]|nr:tRNA uridine-5-carboxymethylaminomethyl(34) synthesis GTPase MnmE [Oscillospiraceae bacterium]
MNETTIAAIATAPGEGGIAVIRVSGPEAISICDRVFCGKETLAAAKTHTLHYGHIVHESKTLDQVLASVMRAPHSYTGEDVVEISCHGGMFVTRSILSAVLSAGATLADRGEFTKRAFLNGKLDLSQAEAVIDLIQAESDTAVSLSVNQLKGKLSEPIRAMREEILHLAAGIDVMVDYPDEDIDETTYAETEKSLSDMIEKLNQMVGEAEQGRLLREGINTVIVGKPNVGKSSLLNCLSGTDRAIVTGQAGTTRDVIEEAVRLDDLRLNLFDTAGIRGEAEAIEAMGIEKAKECLKDADLVLFVLDISRAYDAEDAAIYEMIQGKKTIIILNKSDMEAAGEMPQFAEDIPQVSLSAKYRTGTEQLTKTIKELLSLGVLSGRRDATVINLRHKKAIMQATEALLRGRKTLQSGMPIDFVTVDLREAMEALGSITGQTVSDEIVDEIFTRFCLGK